MADPVLADLNQYLSLAKADLNIDLLYVVNAAGDCIAASNWNTQGSSIGTNFADRDFFRLNKAGQRDMQYAVGKTTHIPGMFFSSPIIINGRFAGAIVAKINVSSLSFLIRQTDAYVVDKNGVIILAHDKDKEMLALDGTAVGKMSVTEKMKIYQKSNFTQLQATSWGDKDFPSLLKIKENMPYVRASTKLSEYGLTVYVEGELPAFAVLQKEQMWLGLLMGLLGGVLIGIVVAVMLYVRSIKRTRTLLLESKNRLIESQHIAMVGSWELDLATNKLEWSDEMFRIFEIDQARFSASRDAFLNAIHPDDKEMFNKAYAEHLVNRAPYEITHRLRMPDGRIKYVTERCNSYFDADGKQLRLIGTVQDVTGNKQAEQILKDSEEKLRSIYEGSSDAIMLLTETGFIDCNARTLAIFGLTSKAEFISMHPSGFSPPIQPDGRDSLTVANEQIATAFAHGSNRFEWMHRRKSGEDFPAEVLLSSFEFQDGRILQATVRDITERKLAENEVLHAKVFLETLIESLPGVFFRLDTAGHLVGWNRTLDVLLGQEGLAKAQLNTLSVIQEEDRSSFASKVQEGFKNGRMEVEARIILKSGATAYFYFIGRSMVVGKELYLLGTGIDITERRAMEESLRTLSTAFEQGPTSVLITDLGGNILHVNPRFSEVTGYAFHEVVGRNARLFQSGLTSEHTYLEMWSTITSGQPWHGELINKRKNGEVYWEENHIAPVKDNLGVATSYISVKVDISDRKLTEQKLRSANQLLDSVIHNIPDMIFLKRASDLRFEMFNRAGEILLGCSSSDLMGRNDYDLFSKEQADFFTQKDREVLDQHGVVEIPEEFINTAKGTRVLHTKKIALRDEHGQPQYLLGISEDITERKAMEEKLQHLAQHDQLTNLPNRALLSDRLQQALVIAKRSRTHLCLMFLDLDEFKPVNDTHGHNVGDLLLREVALRIQECIREADTVSRIGGDEFIVLLPIIEKLQDAMVVAEKIRHSLSLPFELVGLGLRITSSIGIAVYPENGIDETVLLKNADTAMYYAKKSGRNNVQIFQSSMFESSK